MRKLHKCLIAALFLCALHNAALAFTIRFEDKAEGLATGTEITIHALAAPDAEEVELPRSGDGWTYSDASPPVAWYAEPTFVIRVPPRPRSQTLKTDQPALEYTLSFRIPYTERNADITLPIVLFDSVSKDYITSIERLSARDIWRKIQVAAQLAAFWEIDNPNPRNDTGRRLVRLWRDALVQARDYGRPIRIDDGLIEMAQRRYADDPSYFDTTFAKVRLATDNLFWTLKDRPFEAMANGSDCLGAKLLLAHMKGYHFADGETAPRTKEATAEQHVANPMAEFARMERILAAGCPAPQ